MDFDKIPKYHRRSVYLMCFKHRLWRCGFYDQYREETKKAFHELPPSERSRRFTEIRKKYGYKGRDEFFHQLMIEHYRRVMSVLRQVYEENERLRFQVKVYDSRYSVQSELREIYKQQEMEAIAVAISERGPTSSPLPPDLAFAYNNLHLVGDPEDTDTWKIMPDKAPSSGAWTMLIWASQNKDAFMKIIIKEMQDQWKQSGQAASKGQAPSTRDEEEKALAELVREVNSTRNG